MKLTVVAVGKLRSSAARELCDDFLKRLGRYGPAEVLELKPASASDAARGVEQESAAILSALEKLQTPVESTLILDERGTQWTSPELSQWIQNAELRSTRQAALVIGGAYGFSDAVRKRGKLLSLSKMVFPHELVRVITLEQLYRARTIQKGEPYHHA